MGIANAAMAGTGGGTIIGQLRVLLGADTTQLLSGFAVAEKSMVGFTQKANMVSASINRVFAIPALFTMGTQALAFGKFEKGMRNVNTIARMTEDQLRATADEVVRMGSELGKSPIRLTQALYDINSASFKGREGLDILNVAIRSGVAGLADTQKAAKALTSILNAYSLEASAATDVSDMMFKTVERGVLTYDQLTEHLGSTAATASAAGIAFDEVLAGIASMTRGGIHPAEAFTSMNRLILRLVKGTESLNEAVKRYGYESTAALVASKGLIGSMQFLQEETGGSAKELVDLGILIRELRAAMSLTRNEGKDFALDLNLVATGTGRLGATQKAFLEQTKTLAYQWEKLRAVVIANGISYGRLLKGPLVNLMKALRILIGQLNELDDGQKRTLISSAGLVISLGATAKILTVVATKVGFVIAAFAALAAGAAYFTGRISFARDESESFFVTLVRGLQNARLGFISYVRGQIGVFKILLRVVLPQILTYFTNIGIMVDNLFENIKRLVNNTAKAVMDGFSPVFKLFETIVDLYSSFAAVDLPAPLKPMEDAIDRISEGLKRLELPKMEYQHLRYLNEGMKPYMSGMEVDKIVKEIQDEWIKKTAASVEDIFGTKKATDEARDHLDDYKSDVENFTASLLEQFGSLRDQLGMDLGGFVGKTQLAGAFAKGTVSEYSVRAHSTSMTEKQLDIAQKSLQVLEAIEELERDQSQNGMTVQQVNL